MHLLFWSGRQLRRIAIVLVCLGLLAVVLGMGLVEGLMRAAEQDPARAQRWLSLQAHQPIHFRSIQGRWTRGGPVLDVQGLEVGDADRALALGNAELLLSMYRGWLPGEAFSQLRVRGLSVHLFRADDGRWDVLGLARNNTPQADPLNALSRLGELQILDAQLRVQAPSLGIDMRFPRSHLRLRSNERNLQAGLQSWAGGNIGKPVAAALHYDRRKRQGTLWMSAPDAQASDWAPLLRFGDLRVESGHGDLSGWFDLADQQVRRVTVEADLRLLGLRNTAAGSAMQQLDRLQVLGRWQRRGAVWSIDVPQLQVERNGLRSDMGDLSLDLGPQWVRVQARHINGGMLAPVAGLLPWLPERLRQYLQQSELSGTLSDVAFERRNGRILKLGGAARDVSVAATAGFPGIEKLNASVSGNHGQWAIRFSGGAPMRWIQPTRFGEPLTLRPKGTVSVVRKGDGFAFASSDLQLVVEGISAQVQGQVHWPTTGGKKPTLNLQVQSDRVPLSAVRKLLPQDRLPPPALHWLQQAFLDGAARQVDASFRGNLGDWPFAGQAGMGLQVRARIDSATIQFAPGWPAATQVNGNATFSNDGFQVRGTGRVDQIRVGDLRAEIDHYRGGLLKVRAGSVGDASAAMSMLAKSPIAKNDPATFANLKLRGPVRSGFALDLPLRRSTQLEIHGFAELQNVTATDPRYKLTLDNLRGRGEYDRFGFVAPRLQGKRRGQSAELAVRVGPQHVTTDGNLVEVALATAVEPSAIDEYTRSLDWLKPYVSGSSKWTAQFSLPSQRAGPKPAVLELHSDLVGTHVSLPEPLYKPSNIALPTTIEIPMPAGQHEMRIRLGDRAAMRVLAKEKTAPRVQVLLGSNRPSSAALLPGLTVEGTADRLSALDWIAVTRGSDGGGSGKGESLRLNRIDVLGRNLFLFGGNFRNTRIQLQPVSDGAVRILATGPQLQGQVSVPARSAEAIRGQFALVHYANDGLSETAANRTLNPVAAIGKAGQSAYSAAVALTNPANIPPLMFNAQRLQIGSVALGTAQFESVPTANGLQVTRMHVRNPAFAVGGRGQWTQVGRQQHTAISARLTTPNAGRALAVFGAPDRVENGSGNVDLDLSWNGGPQEFALPQLRGSLRLDVREGRIPEVEPGVGRVLGLLSIAELPRRLTLDFRDFFGKGLSFNRVSGAVLVANGQATAQDLVIDASAANIRIEGTSDLQSERFNQLVTVEPRAGGLLTAIGAVAGGPVGAAVGAVANAVLQKPIGAMATKRYRVTGPWTAPKTEVLSAGKP